MISLQSLREIFTERYGGEPRIFSAPGRVNLIGEHTDYNEGFVLPMAANLRTYVAAAPRTDDTIRVYSCNRQDEVAFRINTAGRTSRGWLSYVYGVSRELSDNGHTLVGANVAIASEVPAGAGLSSSAALEISFGFALLRLSARDFDPFELAFAAQRAEHRYVGTKSGLMDQLTCVFGRRDQALLIDCRTLELTPIPIRFGEVALVVCDSKKKHDLASSAYNQRRTECEQAVGFLNKKRPDIMTLRDMGIADLHLLEEMPEPLRRRPRHVVTENDRTLRAAKALATGEHPLLGKLMSESHRSLRDDFEVSCRELDVLVELANAHDGVLGARMMGGGFGGCTINLVLREAIENFRNDVVMNYQRSVGLKADVYAIEADRGVHEHEWGEA
jgi:galactokinase